MKTKLKKELFDMVYGWGRVGIITDEKSNAFQDLIKEIEAQTREETIREILKLIREYIKENEKIGNGNRVITADELYAKISIFRDNL